MGNADLPIGPPDRHVKALRRFGWVKQKRRGKGSHIVMTKPEHPATLTLPGGRSPTRRGTLRGVLDAAGISIEDYVKAYR